METYPEMNAKIVDILRMDDDTPHTLYAAQYIEELQAEIELRKENLVYLNRDLAIAQTIAAVEKERAAELELENRKMKFLLPDLYPEVNEWHDTESEEE